VDDNPADLDLTHEVLKKSMHNFSVNTAEDGAQAIAFLQRTGDYAQKPRPDLIVLDLNLPCRHGREVLKEVKTTPELAWIPVVVFTSSQATSDVNQSYDLGANCYLRKPGNLTDFRAVVQSLADFWLSFAILPRRENQ
jgi:two-component system, chemotaxis family, response regulator Rcp1